MQVGTAITMYGSTGIISATRYYGDGTNLTGILNNTISPSSASTSQFIGFSSVSSGVNTSIGVSSTFVFIPSSGNLGIGTTNPRGSLQVGTAITMYGSTGIISATRYYGDGTNLTGILNNTISPSSASTSQFIGFSSVSSGVNTSIGVSSTFVFIPSSGNLGIGTTNPQATLNVVPTSSSIAGLFSGTTSGDMVRINQTGTGNALVVEDETNPDATPFIVTSIGRVGIGTTNPSTALGVIGTLTIGIAGNNVSISSTELFRPNSSFTMRGGGSQSERNSITLTNDSGIIIDGGSTETYGVELKGGGGPVKVTQGTFLVGTSATTGTASQPLQVTGGAYVSGSVGIGTTNPEKLLHLVTSIATPLIIQRTTTNNSAAEYRNTDASMWAGLLSNATGWGVGATADLGADAQIVVTRTGGELLVGSVSTTGTSSQKLQVTGGAYVSGNLGIGTTNPGSKLTVNGAVQIQQDSGSNNRFILRGQPASLYRWNIDNNGSSNDFRIFREDDVTAANGSIAVSISTIGTLTATRFSGDGSLLTNLPPASSQWVTTSVGIHTLSNVGIGTTNPTSKLTVSGNASITGILTADQVYTSNNGGGQNVRIGDDLWIGDINVSNTTRFSGAQDSTKAFIIFGSSDAVALGRTGTGPLYYGGDFTISGVATANSFRARGGAPGAIGVNNNGYGFFSPGDNDSGMYSSADGQIEFYSNNNEAARITINRNLLIGTTAETGTASQILQVTGGAYVSGNLGIGTTNPTSKLYVVGNAYITGVTTSTDFDSLSDINLKTNINQIANPLEKVMQIRGVTFNWKDGNRNSAGVIAQEIEKILPELVHGGETKTVNYNGLIGLLIECVKKQQEEIDELKRKVN